MNQNGDKQAHPVSDAADWISLAAAPTFVVMALLIGMHARGMPDMLCSATRDASPLTGAVPMYLLMGAFHSAPWLKLIFRRGSTARGVVKVTAVPRLLTQHAHPQAAFKPRGRATPPMRPSASACTRSE
jgi:hypothetical protein